ncbi:MAG: DUF4186 family protein [Halobacteriovoraceae bacterium]|nr:DUF4186 family protein [Halobacteriovoraceae bacterium]MBT5092889.1 DUF4186 family protein [Halobacteriovoraceae bacterium]
MNPTIEILNRLSHSSFRRQFKLTSNELDFIRQFGMERVIDDAHNLLRIGLPSFHRESPGADLIGKEGDPARKAMLACGLCCRRCLASWHQIPQTEDLVERELHHFLSLLLSWFHQQKRRPNCSAFARSHSAGPSQLALF